MKNLNILAISAVACISFIGCGDTDKVSDTKATQDTKQEQKVEKASKSIDKPFIKKYGIRSGRISYDIKGSGNILGVSTKTIGKKRLIFSNYGSRELIEENSVEKQDVYGKKNITKKHTIVYNKDAVIYNVDFEQKRIVRMKNPAISMMLGLDNSDLSKIGENLMRKMGGKKIGTDNILGYDCDIWSLMGSKQCIYHGIVLKLETNVMGMKRVEIATKAKFNIDIDKESFKLPDFPISGITSNMEKLDKMDEQAKQEALKVGKEVVQMGESIKEAQKKIKANPNMSDKEREKVIMESMMNSKSMMSKFEKQKASMPKMLKMMKSYRACIADTNSQSDMDECVKKVKKSTHKLGLDELGDNEEEKLVWSKANREKTLKEIDEGIKEVSKSLPCMKKSNNMMEFIECARGMH